MRVLFVTAEMDDFVRVGGLAAVSAALPRALISTTDVRVMLPGYRDVVEQLIPIDVSDEDTWRDAARVASSRDWQASEADLIDQAIAVPDDDSEFDR